MIPKKPDKREYQVTPKDISENYDRLTKGYSTIDSLRHCADKYKNLENKMYLIKCYVDDRLKKIFSKSYGG